MMNMPSNDTSSNQQFLLTHLYQFFGSLLGCSTYGMPGFPAYDGFPSQFAVHRFMNLDENEVGYFIQQVGLAATSFGVTQEDATAVGQSLNMAFGYRCAPNATIIAAQGPNQQSICSADSCPLAEGAVCDQYAPVVEPANATSSATGTASGTASPTATGSSTPTGSAPPSETTPVQAGASYAGVNVAALFAAVGFAMLLI